MYTCARLHNHNDNHAGKSIRFVTATPERPVDKETLWAALVEVKDMRAAGCARCAR